MAENLSESTIAKIKAGGLSKEEAKHFFGTDFTGVIQDPNTGTFTPDQSAIDRLLSPTGITKPDSGDLVIPSADFATSEQMITPESLQDLISPFEETEAEKAERARVIGEQFAPAIAEAGITGEKKLGTTEALAAQPELPGFSTVLQGEIREIEKDTERQIAELETRRDAAILAGDTTAAADAKASLDLAFKIQNQIFQQKMQLVSQQLAINAAKLEEEKFGESKSQFEQTFGLSQEQFGLQTEQIIANLTGIFRGSPTFEAENQALQNMIAIAGLTGEFAGELTVAEQTRLANEAFQQARLTGVFEGEPTLAALSFEEAIRSNKAQEALRAQANAISGARAALDKKQVVTDRDGNFAILNLTDNTVEVIKDSEGNPLGAFQDLSQSEQFTQDMTDGFAAISNNSISIVAGLNRLVKAYPGKLEDIQIAFEFAYPKGNFWQNIFTRGATFGIEDVPRSKERPK